MKKIKIFLIGIIFPISLLQAQTDFRKGYVISHSNDTLYGEIDYLGNRLMSEICRFRSNTNIIVEYTPYDIVAYRFSDSKYFISRQVSGKKVFLEILIKGQANIYYLRDDLGDHYYIDKEDLPLVRIPYKEGIIERDGKQYAYATKTHLGVLNYFLMDAPVTVQKQINEMKKPQHNNLIKLIKDYHYAVCMDKESCIVFEKKIMPVKIFVDVKAGMVFFRTNQSSFTSGVLLSFLVPHINEKLYFRTGLLRSKIDGEFGVPGDFIYSKGSAIYKTPFMLEYIYQKSIIRPKVAGGLSVYYKPYFHSYTYMGGVNIQINSSMSLSFEYAFDFIHAEIYTFSYQHFSHSFLGGFHFKF